MTEIVKPATETKLHYIISDEDNYLRSLHDVYKKLAREGCEITEEIKSCQGVQIAGSPVWYHVKHTIIPTTGWKCMITHVIIYEAPVINNLAPVKND